MVDSGDRFPIGMRVLAVDDDPTCLLVLETLLRRCQYHVTTTSQAITALTMLRENKDKFDLVISDVHMPDMDGFKLLELVGLEMDLPVIMLSAYGDTKLVMKGISHGACDYLLKPVRLEELKNIWQHVIRKKKSDPKEKNKTSKPDKTTSDSGSGLRSAGAENSDENGKLTKKRKDQDEDEDEDKENGNDNEDPSAQKKPRVVWSVELHRKFVAAVNQLGIDKAVPKKILDMMNVENITRENVASHLQKYRLYLKRISCVANQQASMVAALGSADQSYLRMGGSGHFHNNAFRSFSPSGIIGNLNTPTSLNGHGFSPSGLLQLGQSRNLNNSCNDQLKFQSAITPVNQNILQGMPMSIGFDHLQNSKGVISVQNLNTDVKTTFPIPNKFPDQRPSFATSSSHPPSLGISNNGLMLDTHPERKHGGIGIGYGSSSSSVASQHSEFSFSMLDQGRHGGNWSSDVPISGIQTNSFSSSECFRQTAVPPSDNMASLPLQAGYSGGSLPDMHSQGMIFTLLHSLAYLPRAAQRRLRSYHLILCLGSADRAVDSSLAADLGLRLVHVDTSRAEEIADTVMALFLGLLRRTHLLSRHALSASGWLGSVQPLCRGMRRCRGLVLGIVGRSASARALATRSLAFKMSVLYFDVHSGQAKMKFPPAARKMDTLNDLLAASDLISLHCALTNETMQIISAECLQHVKPGAFLVNTGSSQLLDDCALKQLLIDGTIAGCALDGAEGPQWMEAWVKEMPNVLILPRSADYSEEVWMEIREKAISILQTFFIDGIIPKNALSDAEEESEVDDENEQSDQQYKENALQIIVREQLDDGYSNPESSQKKVGEVKESSSQHQVSSLTLSTSTRSEGRRSRSSKKAKKRHIRQKSQQKSDQKEGTSQRDDTAMSGTDQALSSSSEDSRSRKTPVESLQEPIATQALKSSTRLSGKCTELLKDGCIIALHATDRSALYVSRQRVKGGGWILDSMPDVSKRDPAAQFLIIFRNKDTIGLRSLAAGGKLLQINRRMEFVFASHSFDVWENWTLEGSIDDEWRLVNCRNPSAVLDHIYIEILAASDEDGITRWLENF